MSNKWKYVSVGKCIFVMIISLIFIGSAFIPYSLAPYAGETVYTYTKLPYVGDSSLLNYFDELVITVQDLLKIDGYIFAVVSFLIKYSPYLLYATLCFNVAGAFLVAITRFNFLRFIFRVVSIFAAIYLIFAMIIFNFTAVVSVIHSLETITDISSIGAIIFDNGIILYLALGLISFIMIFVEFKAFKKPF